MMNTISGGLPEWKKYICLFAHVSELNIRDKRRIFTYIRDPEMHPDTYIPSVGMTLSEFATFQLLSDSRRRMSR